MRKEPRQFTKLSPDYMQVARVGDLALFPMVKKGPILTPSALAVWDSVSRPGGPETISARRTSKGGYALTLGQSRGTEKDGILVAPGFAVVRSAFIPGTRVYVPHGDWTEAPEECSGLTITGTSGKVLFGEFLTLDEVVAHFDTEARYSRLFLTRWDFPRWWLEHGDRAHPGTLAYIRCVEQALEKGATPISYARFLRGRTK